jgi:hypothetical protein
MMIQTSGPNQSNRVLQKNFQLSIRVLVTFVLPVFIELAAVAFL